jgi:hypothetical protein
VRRRTWIAVSGTCLAAALIVAAPTGLLVRDPNPAVHVRWAESTAAAERAALEQRLQLAPLEQMAATTWRYEVLDTSRDNLEAIVREPNIQDTHFVDRGAFAISPEAPAAPRRPGPIGQRWPALAFAIADYGPPLLLLLALAAGLCARRPDLATLAHARHALTRAIPELSPRGLTVFRLVYGVVLVAYIYLHPSPQEAIPREAQRSDVPLIDVAAIQWLVAHPAVVRAGQLTAMAAAALFAAGVMPRVCYAIAVAGIVQWLLMLSLHEDSHQFGVLILPLIALLPVPWHAPDSGRHKRYGYAPWLLSFALGVAWLGAAWAKVREGPGWILNGTVRYHFVSDAGNAPVDWGLAIAAMPLVAVLLSGGAVLIESLTIAPAFVRTPFVRLLAGVAAMSVLAGFYVFQGILWPAWWLLLLGFVPWQWFDRSATPDTTASRVTLSRAQLFCIVALGLQQVVMSAAFIEFPPVSSRYDMYSKTHDSPADYERENPGIVRRILAEDASGDRTDVTACAADLAGTPWSNVRAIDPQAGSPSTAPLRACLGEAPPPERYVVLEDRCPFDWNAGETRCMYRDKLIGAFPASGR